MKTQPQPHSDVSPVAGRRPSDFFLRYGVVVVCILVAFGIRFSLTPLIIDYDPFMFFAPAALIAAWFGGIGPGIAAWIAGIVVGDYFFTGPLYEFGPYGPIQITLMATYTVETAIGIVLIEALKKLRVRAQKSAEQAHRRGERLEAAMAERKRVEEALRLREGQMQLITDSLPVLISYIDKEQCYRFLNQQYEIWFGLPRSEAYGRHLKAVWGETAYNEMRPSIDAAFRGEQVTYERWVVNAKGNRCNQTTYIPHRGESGAVEGLFKLVTDITEQKQNEEAVREAQAELSKHAAELEARVAERTVKLKESLDDMERLLYSVAHDLRAPLRAMQGFATLLEKQYAPELDAAGKDYTRRIAEAASRMDQLILDLLAYGRLSHVPFECNRIELKASLDAALARLQTEVLATNAEIQVRQPMPAVWANSTLLEEIFTNLLSNALKFVAPGVSPRAQINAELSGEKVRLWVTDNGIGIPTEYHQKIFKLFERLHGPIDYPGTGIGLAIVAKGMERLGGRAGVISNAGEGSCFWLELPTTPPKS